MASKKVEALIQKTGGVKFTVGEIAEASGYTEFTIRRHISEGILSSVKVSGRRFILEDEAVKYLKGVSDDVNK